MNLNIVSANELVGWVSAGGSGWKSLICLVTDALHQESRPAFIRAKNIGVIGHEDAV